MHAAPARYVSVSELYSADEVELLLDEIRELEPTSCRGEDVQDFEIAGSGLGGCAGAGAGAAGAGGRSPCGTELTERSWDSHAHYSRAPPPRPLHVAPLYCHVRHLLTPAGAAALLIVLCCVSSCACVWSLVGVRSWQLPAAPRVRLLLLAALSSALTHLALLFVHVSRLAALLPLQWRALRMVCAGAAAGGLLAGGAAVLLSVLLAPEYRAAPPHVARLLLAAAGLGLCGGCVALLVAGVDARALYARHARQLAGPRPPPASASAELRASYRAVPSAPPPPAPHAPRAPQPSTSRDNPL